MRRLITALARETPYLLVSTFLAFFQAFGVAALFREPWEGALRWAIVFALFGITVGIGRALWAARRRRRWWVTRTDIHSSRIAYSRRE
jgi:hypothetical protein